MPEMNELLNGKTFRDIIADAKSLDEAGTVNTLKSIHTKFLMYVSTLDSKIAAAENELLNLVKNVSAFDVETAVKKQYELKNLVEQRRQTMELYKAGFKTELTFGSLFDKK